jgi:transposase
MAVSSDDFFASLDLSTWLEDETLYSWAARFHRLNANVLPSMTSRMLFGHPSGGRKPDLPDRIGTFVDRTQGQLGSALEIIQRRTLLPYFWAVRGDQATRQAINALSGDRAGNLKFMLGLLTGRFGAAHPLKACPACVESDRASHEVAHWRRSHQLPSVWVCSAHGMLLQLLRCDGPSTVRYDWALPSLNVLRAPANAWRVSTRGAPDQTRLQRLALISQEMVQQAPGVLAVPRRVAAVLRRRLAAHGLITGGDRIRWSDLASLYLEHIAPMTYFPALCNLPADPQAVRAQLMRLLQEPRSPGHPIQYLVLIEWLYEDWEEFQADQAGNAADACVEPAQQAVVQVAGSDSAQQWRQMEAVRLSKCGLSATAIAAQLDVDPHTVMAWNAARGLAPNRRPKRLSGDVRLELLVRLQRGDDKVSAAAAAGVSVSTVTRVLRTEPGLQMAWHHARRLQAQKTARSAWERLLPCGHELGVKAMRRLEPAAYAWLYRNDTTWLQAHSPTLNDPAAGGNHASRRLAHKDVRLALEVERAALWCAEQYPVQRVTLDRLKACVERLELALRRPDRVPQTLHAIVRALDGVSSAGIDGQLRLPLA